MIRVFGCYVIWLSENLDAESFRQQQQRQSQQHQQQQHQQQVRLMFCEWRVRFAGRACRASRACCAWRVRLAGRAGRVVLGERVVRVVRGVLGVLCE